MNYKLITVLFIVSQVLAFYFNFLYTGNNITFGNGLTITSVMIGYIFVFAGIMISLNEKD